MCAVLHWKMSAFFFLTHCAECRSMHMRSTRVDAWMDRTLNQPAFLFPSTFTAHWSQIQYVKTFPGNTKQMKWVSVACHYLSTPCVWAQKVGDAGSNNTGEYQSLDGWGESLSTSKCCNHFWPAGEAVNTTCIPQINSEGWARRLRRERAFFSFSSW